MFGDGNDLCANGAGVDNFDLFSQYGMILAGSSSTNESIDPQLECPDGGNHQTMACNDNCEFYFYFQFHTRSRVTIEFGGDASSPTHVVISSYRDIVFETLEVFYHYENSNTPSTRQTVVLDAREMSNIVIDRYTGILYLYSIHVGASAFVDYVHISSSLLCSVEEILT